MAITTPSILPLPLRSLRWRAAGRSKIAIVEDMVVSRCLGVGPPSGIPS